MEALLLKLYYIYIFQMDLFIAQTVFQYLCLKKHLVAAVAFYAYTTGHPSKILIFILKINTHIILLLF